jgi:hypothetical protein
LRRDRCGQSITLLVLLAALHYCRRDLRANRERACRELRIARRVCARQKIIRDARALPSFCSLLTRASAGSYPREATTVTTAGNPPPSAPSWPGHISVKVTYRAAVPFDSFDRISVMSSGWLELSHRLVKFRNVSSAAHSRRSFATLHRPPMHP